MLSIYHLKVQAMVSANCILPVILWAAKQVQCVTASSLLLISHYFFSNRKLAEVSYVQMMKLHGAFSLDCSDAHSISVTTEESEKV